MLDVRWSFSNVQCLMADIYYSLSNVRYSRSNADYTMYTILCPMSTFQSTMDGIRHLSSEATDAGSFKTVLEVLMYSRYPIELSEAKYMKAQLRMARRLSLRVSIPHSDYCTESLSAFLPSLDLEAHGRSDPLREVLYHWTGVSFSL